MKSSKDEAAPLEKRVNKFTWSAVDPGLTKVMLEAVYADGGRQADTTAARALDPEPLARMAARALGSPLSSSHMEILFPVLKDRWVPKLKGDARLSRVPWNFGGGPVIIRLR